MTKSMSFRTTPGVNHVEYKVCHVSTGGLNAGAESCSSRKKTVVARVTLPPQKERGQVRVDVWACTAYPTAGSKPCGEPTTEYYSQAQVIDTEAVDLARRVQQQESQQSFITQRIVDTLERFEKDSKACQENGENIKKLEVIRNYAKNLLAVGEKYLDRAFAGIPDAALEEDAVASVPEGESVSGASAEEAAVADAGQESLNDEDVAPDNETEFLDTTRNQELTTQMAQATEASGKAASQFEEYNSFVQNTAKAVGFFEESKPVDAVETLGLALFDIFTAKSQIPMKCLAKDRAESEIKVLKKQLRDVKRNIRYLKRHGVLAPPVEEKAQPADEEEKQEEQNEGAEESDAETKEGESEQQSQDDSAEEGQL